MKKLIAEIRNAVTGWSVKRLTLLFPILVVGAGGGLLLTSCTSETEEVDEYENWPARNQTFFASLEDSLKVQPSQWLKLKNWSLNPAVEGESTDYIYAKVVTANPEGQRPCYTDSVRVIYQGRLLPTKSNPQGKVFDGSVYGTYSSKTSASVKFKVSAMTEGFSTALQNMRRGEYWRIYVPSQLGYGVSGTTGIPAYSVLIFDVTLLDSSPTGIAMREWN